MNLIFISLENFPAESRGCIEPLEGLRTSLGQWAEPYKGLVYYLCWCIDPSRDLINLINFAGGDVRLIKVQTIVKLSLIHI